MKHLRSNGEENSGASDAKEGNITKNVVVRRLSDSSYNSIWNLIKSKDFEALELYLREHPEETSIFRQKGPQKKTLLHRMCQPPLGYTDVCGSLVTLIVSQAPSLAAIPLDDEYPLHMAIRNLNITNGDHFLVPLIRAYPPAAGMLCCHSDHEINHYLYPLEAIFSSPAVRPPASVVNELLATQEGFETLRLEGRMAPLDYFQQYLFPDQEHLRKFLQLGERHRQQYRQEVRRSAEWTIAKLLILSEYRQRRVNLQNPCDNSEMIKACFSIPNCEGQLLEIALILNEQNELNTTKSSHRHGDNAILPIHLACRSGHYVSMFYIMETVPETVKMEDARGLPLDYFLAYISERRVDPEIKWQSRKQRRTILKLLQVYPQSVKSVLTLLDYRLHARLLALVSGKNSCRSEDVMFQLLRANPSLCEQAR